MRVSERNERHPVLEGARRDAAVRRFLTWFEKAPHVISEPDDRWSGILGTSRRKVRGGSRRGAV